MDCFVDRNLNWKVSSLSNRFSVKFESFCNFITGMDVFITEDRQFWIDTGPVFYNLQKQDSVASEVEDLKLLITLLAISHVILVVQNDGIDMNLMRLLHLAENMKLSINKCSTYLPTIFFIHNKVRFIDGVRSKVMEKMYKKIFGQSRLKIYREQSFSSYNNDIALHKTLNFCEIPLASDTSNFYNKIDGLRDKITLLNRQPMWPEFEQITERKFLQIVTIVSESARNDHFIRQYENFREKLIQQNQNVLMVSNDKDYY